MKIRFAITPPAYALHENIFADYLAACEALGFDTVWLSDIPLGDQGVLALPDFSRSLVVRITR